MTALPAGAAIRRKLRNLGADIRLASVVVRSLLAACLLDLAMTLAVWSLNGSVDLLLGKVLHLIFGWLLWAAMATQLSRGIILGGEATAPLGLRFGRRELRVALIGAGVFLLYLLPGFVFFGQSLPVVPDLVGFVRMVDSTQPAAYQMALWGGFFLSCYGFLAAMFVGLLIPMEALQGPGAISTRAVVSARLIRSKLMVAMIWMMGASVVWRLVLRLPQSYIEDRQARSSVDVASDVWVVALHALATLETFGASAIVVITLAVLWKPASAKLKVD